MKKRKAYPCTEEPPRQRGVEWFTYVLWVLRLPASERAAMHANAKHCGSEKGKVAPCYEPWRAAQRGHLECLRNCHKHNIDWGSHTMLWAAREGHLECLQFAHENGCSWTGTALFGRIIGNATVYAGMMRQFDCLIYAHTHGCPLTTNTMYCAATSGFSMGETDIPRQMVEYLLAANCPYNVRLCRMRFENCYPCVSESFSFSSNYCPNCNDFLRKRSQVREIPGLLARVDGISVLLELLCDFACEE